MNLDQTIHWLNAIHKASLQIGNDKKVISSLEKQSLNDLSREFMQKILKEAQN